jgi:hypothetical protein
LGDRVRLEVGRQALRVATATLATMTRDPPSGEAACDRGGKAIRGTFTGSDIVRPG